MIYKIVLIKGGGVDSNLDRPGSYKLTEGCLLIINDNFLFAADQSLPSSDSYGKRQPPTQQAHEALECHFLFLSERLYLAFQRQ